MALVAMYATSTWALSSVAPTGQTLYYKIVSGGAQVVDQNTTYPYSNIYPTGALTIPDSVTFNGITYAVTSIGSYAFHNCNGLTSVTIPESVTSIGSSAFYNCFGLTSINIPDGVTSIGRAAFSGCSSLTSITIPNSVTFLGNYAFDLCSRLTSVTISDSITSLGAGLFNGCSRITSVTIPDRVTSIGNYAFCGCNSLTSVTIGNNVTTIGDYAFYHCIGLTSVNIPNRVISIGREVFRYCSGLTSVTIPDSVISIGNYAFSNCSSLTSVTIGNGVTTIGFEAFWRCSALKVMRMKPATPPTLGSNSSICDSIIDLVVPHNSYDAYTQAGDNYTRHHIFADSAFVTITINNNAWGYVTGCANDTVFTYPYSDTAEIELVATPYPGYHFVRWDDYTTDSIRTITNIIHDITVKAHFAHDHNNDIDDVETLNAKVYSSQRQIVVEGAEGNMVTLYDVNGRMLTAKQDHDMPLRFDVPVSGTYLVKIGNHPAKKVIVVR